MTTPAFDGQMFDLETSVARRVYGNRRAARYIFGLSAVLFFALTVYGLAKLPLALSYSESILASYLFAVALVGFLTFLCASVALVSSGRPATQLNLTAGELSLQFPSRSAPVRCIWAERSFRITLRDFRGHSTPVSDLVQIERIGRAPFWLQPPSTPLTSPAFEALLHTAKEKGLTITEKKGHTFFSLWSNTEITIRRTSQSLAR
jgi:hypothetical protein